MMCPQSSDYCLTIGGGTKKDLPFAILLLHQCFYLLAAFE